MTSGCEMQLKTEILMKIDAFWVSPPVPKVPQLVLQFKKVKLVYLRVVRCLKPQYLMVISENSILEKTTEIEISPVWPT